jgi:transcriptional regulator with XRE-family HTH domain
MPSVPKKNPKPLPKPLPIGKHIAALRKSKGLTQTALGDLLGLSQKQITAYETGKTHLTDEMIVRFALALDTSADELLGLKGMKTKSQKPNLRFTRRIRELEHLPEAKKKRILQVLDDLIRANN